MEETSYISMLQCLICYLTLTLFGKSGTARLHHESRKEIRKDPPRKEGLKIPSNTDLDNIQGQLEGHGVRARKGGERGLYLLKTLTTGGAYYVPCIRIGGMN